MTNRIYFYIIEYVKIWHYAKGERYIMYHSMKIAGLERQLPLCPLNEKLMIAGFVMFGDAELTVACADELLKKAPEFDYIITAEAKGIPLAHEMSRQSGKKYFVARKKPKLYMTGVFDVAVNSITTEGEQHLYLDTAEAAQMKGKKAIIVDDVISTGESLKAVEKLIEMAEVDYAGALAVLAEGDAADRDDIIYLEKLPLFDSEGNAL